MALVFKSVIIYGWKRGGVQVSVVVVRSLPFIDIGIPVPCVYPVCGKPSNTFIFCIFSLVVQFVKFLFSFLVLVGSMCDYGWTIVFVNNRGS
jgi:hypothetical protein